MCILFHICGGALQSKLHLRTEAWKHLKRWKAWKINLFLLLSAKFRKNPGYWVLAIPWFEGKIEQGVSSFFAKFLPYLMIFWSGVYWSCLVAVNRWKIIGENIWHKMKKSLVQFCLKPVFRLISGTHSATTVQIECTHNDIFPGA